MAHDGHDWWTGDEIFRTILFFIFAEEVFFHCRFQLDRCAVFFGNDLCCFKIQLLVHRGHHAHAHQLHDDFRSLLAELLSQLLHSDRAFDDNMVLNLGKFMDFLLRGLAFFVLLVLALAALAEMVAVVSVAAGFLRGGIVEFFFVDGVIFFLWFLFVATALWLALFRMCRSCSVMAAVGFLLFGRRSMALATALLLILAVVLWRVVFHIFTLAVVAWSFFALVTLLFSRLLLLLCRLLFVLFGRLFFLWLTLFFCWLAAVCEMRSYFVCVGLIDRTHVVAGSNVHLLQFCDDGLRVLTQFLC